METDRAIKTKAFLTSACILTSIVILTCTSERVLGHTFDGIVEDSESGDALSNVEVRVVEDSKSVVTDANGAFRLTALDANNKTLTFEQDEYVFLEIQTPPRTSMAIALRKRKKSAASYRWSKYIASSKAYNSLDYVEDKAWHIRFKQSDLTGDFAPDPDVTRRDPSAVIRVNDLYYVWYTRGTGPVRGFGTGDPGAKVFPWDKCDVWYARSSDGWRWEEMGPAVERGEAGSFDDRSVFTPEIFAHDGKYYLVYQVVKAPYVQRVKNTVAMSVADSPNGPWTKLPEPILKPTNNGVWAGEKDDRHSVVKKGYFDSHKVHDPCLIYYKHKFYLYYKGERMGEERYYGQREIKWGVAIADHSQGPYVKSEYNPITNTGHEVCVWPYKDGIAFINALDGPERGTIQFAEDGINFEIKSRAVNMPHAFGLFRPDNYDSHPHDGVTWGLCHVLKWDRPGGWMYIRRFDKHVLNVVGVNIVGDALSIQIGTTRQLSARIIPADATDEALGWASSDESVAGVDSNGLVTANSLGTATIKVTSSDGDFTDSCVIIVQSEAVVVIEYYIEAEEFVATGSTTGRDNGGHNGVNATGIGINFVNSGDWAEYITEIATDGLYKVEYFISTPSDEAEISFRIDGKNLTEDAVPNNGEWDVYEFLIAANLIALKEGRHTFRLVASGRNPWQWNLEHFELTRIADMP